MSVELHHPMNPERTAAEAARGRFVSGMRSFILHDLASDMRRAYDKRAARAFARKAGRAPKTSNEVHQALRGDTMFATYSAMRVQAQKMVWSAAGSIVERDLERLEAEAQKVANHSGSVTLDPDFPIPRNVDAIEVHLMPGSYTRGGQSLEAGAVYDQGLAVFSMGLMGANLDDIGLSMAAWVSAKFPRFKPERILDTGCTIGHNSLPWKQTYPLAHVEAIDVAAGVLRYADARAKMQKQEVYFRQMSADALDYEDASFALVFSSMFLHELPKKTRAKTFEEAFRVLKPGGLLLHMELPPNDQMNAYDGFYLDWDSWYNAEPFYKGYRDENPKKLCSQGGFDDEDYFQFTVPSLGFYGLEAIAEAIANEDINTVDSETTGRLAEGIMWFGFGAWKR